MDVNQFLHAMPEVAQEEITKSGVNPVSIGDGVNRLQMSGHDRGLSYRFDTHLEYNPAKSEAAGYEVFDEIEVCFRFIDRKNIIPMPVFMAPKEILAFNRAGECIGGRYKDAYLAWKSGKQAPGTSLRKWDVLSNTEIASLEADGIFTIEQYAEYPRERIVSRYPQNFIDAHTRAQQWVAGKEIRAKAGEHVAMIKALEAKLAEQEREKIDLADRLAKLEALTSGEARKEKVKNKLLEN